MNKCIAADDDLLQCITACPLECDITNFPGVLSFSQLSAYVTNGLLNSNKNKLYNSYLKAFQLADRLDNAEFADDLIAISTQTNSLLSLLTTNYSKVLVSYSEGLLKFQTDVVERDMMIMQNMLTKFSNVYDSLYKSMRHKAADYFRTAVLCLDDLTFEIVNSATSFAALYDAQWFYTRLLSSLSKCASNSGLAVQYLSKVLNDELTIQTQFNPATFIDDKNVQSCNDVFFVILNTFERVSPFLSYSIHRLTQWQADNVQDIMANTITTLLDLPMTVSSSPNNSNGIWPGFWQLLNITERFDQLSWIKIVENMNDSISSKLSYCLLNYELTLEAAINSVEQFINSPPYLFPNDTVGDILHELDVQNAALGTLLNLYLTGKIASLKAAVNVREQLKNISDNLSLLDDKWTSMKEAWLDGITLWSASVHTAYESFIYNMSILNLFIIANDELSFSVSQMQMWYRPFIIIEPIVQLDTNIPNSSSTAENIALTWPSYFKESASNIVKATLDDIQTKIRLRIKELANLAKSEANEWYSQQVSLEIKAENYQNSILFDDAFIK